MDKIRRNVTKTVLSAPFCLWAILNAPWVLSSDWQNWGFQKKRQDMGDSDLSELVQLGEPGYGGDDPDAKKLMEKYLPLITQKMYEKGYNTRDPWTAEITKTIFLKPGKIDDMKAYQIYSNKVTNFLYEELPKIAEYNTLFVPDSINWVIPKKGDNFAQGYEEKAFLVDTMMEYLSYVIQNKKQPKQSITMRSLLTLGSRSQMYLECDKKLHNCYWYAILSAGNNAINAPFSELIPLATKDMAKKFKGVIRSSEFNKLVEAFSESISYLLGLKITDKLKIPNGKEIVENFKERMMRYPEYEYLPGAIKWVRKYGLEKALDIYMTEPNRFLKEIKSLNH